MTSLYLVFLNIYCTAEQTQPCTRVLWCPEIHETWNKSPPNPTGMDRGGYFDASSFSKSHDGEINGFIENVDRDLRKFFHANRRSTTTTYVLAVFLGLLGVHHFYLGRKLYGVMYLCTFGLFGVGYVVDLFRIPTLVKEANVRRVDEEEDRTLGDLYVLWFPCGILGKCFPCRTLSKWDSR